MDGGLGRSFADILDLMHGAEAPAPFELGLRRFDQEGEQAVLALAEAILPGAAATWLDPEDASAAPEGAFVIVRFERIDRTSCLCLARDAPPTADEAGLIYSLALLVTLAFESAGPVRFRLEWP